MSYELKLDSPFVSAQEQNYSSPSLQPPDDFPISVNSDGTTLSVYGDECWDISPYARRTKRLHFWDAKTTRRTCRLSEGNGRLFRRVTFYLLYGSRPLIAAVTVERHHRNVAKILRLCNDEGILLSELHRFERVWRKLSGLLSGNSGHVILKLLDELYAAREEIGFEILRYDQIRMIRQQISPRSGYQTLYIPERIYYYQMRRCGEMLNDYLLHKEKFEALFRYCLDAYRHANGSFEALFSKRKQRRIARKPFASHSYYGGLDSFADVARKFGVADIIERWSVDLDKTIDATTIQVFSRYLTAVQLVGRVYLITFSGMRKDEASSLRADCLVVDEDATLGKSYTLRGETSKTIDDNSALWITSSEAQIAVDAMASVARLRLSAAALDSRVPLTQSEITNPKLVTRTYEPWASAYGRDANMRYTVHSTFKRWMEKCPRLLDHNELKITPEDMRIAALVTPTFDPAKCAIGKPWPLSYHQLRRTLICNAANSGLVTIQSLQYQVKHQHSSMTLYYGHNYSALSLNQSLCQEYADAVVEATAMKALDLPGENFVSPLGPKHKQRLVEFIGTKELNGLMKLAKQGKFAVRATALGVCMRNGFCPYGGIDNLTHCIGCDEALADKRKRASLVELCNEVELELAVVSPRDVIYRESLQTQQRTLRKAIDVILV